MASRSRLSTTNLPSRRNGPIASVEAVPDPLPDGLLRKVIVDERFQPLGLSTGQIPVLYVLKDGAALTQKELARLVRIEQPTMAQLLTRMERDGLIRRTDNPDDKRSSLISLTPLALKKLPQAKTILSEGNKAALKGFTDREIVTLSKLLLRVVKNLDPEIAAEIESMHTR